MAQDEAVTIDPAVAVAERPEPDAVPVAIDPSAKPEKKGKAAKEDDVEYEVEFETPFGKIEFELEPLETKERRDRARREKADREAAKAAAKAAKKTEQRLRSGKPEQLVASTGGGSKLVPILLIFLLVAGAVALAIWLFARPGAEDEDAIPLEFRNTEEDAAAEPEPLGFAAKAQHRVRNAIHAGRQASRDAQSEQERRFEDLTGKK